MEEFLNRLYSYEYFGTYLMISIAVLILLFIIILFFGKKDQKKREIEETKKLQQINADNSFKEDSVGEKVEIPLKDALAVNEVKNDALVNPTVTPNVENNVVTPEVNNQTIVNDNITQNVTPTLENNQAEEIVPQIEIPNEIENLNTDKNIETLNQMQPLDLNISNEPSVQEIEPKVENANPFVFEDVTLNNSLENPSAPLLSKEEEKPLVFDTFSEPTDVPSVPEFNFDEIIRGVEETKKESNPTLYTVPNETREEHFGNVLEPKEDTVDPFIDYARAVESSPVEKKETPKGPEIFSSVFVPEENSHVEEKNVNDEEVEDDFELPVLKKNVEEDDIELPSLNDLSGETYNIK